MDNVMKKSGVSEMKRAGIGERTYAKQMADQEHQV